MVAKKSKRDGGLREKKCSKEERKEEKSSKEDRIQEERKKS